MGYDTWDLRSAGKLDAHPGSIDNAALFKCKCNLTNYESLFMIFFFRLNSGNFKRPSCRGVRLRFIAQTSMGLVGLEIWPLPRL